MRAMHEQKNFQCGASGSFSMMCPFVCQKLRQMGSKIRGIATCPTSWEQLERKLTVRQREAFVKLCRCIDNRFLGSSEGAELSPSPVRS